MIVTVENGRWIVRLAGGGKDYPPTDEDGFRAFARSEVIHLVRPPENLFHPGVLVRAAFARG